MNEFSQMRHCWVALLTSAVLVSGCVEAEESTTSGATTEPAVEVIDTSQTDDSANNLQLLEKLNRLSQEVLQLRGKVEVLEFELEQTRSRQRQLYDDLDQRIRQFEREVQGDVEVVEPEPDTSIQLPDTGTEAQDQLEETETTTETEPAPAVVVADPAAVREVYDGAFQALREGRYEDAITQFETLIQTYPDSDLVDDSMYWIAESNYVTQNYQASLPEFERVIREYPESQRAPEAMLKIGYIYYDMEQFESARDYLLEVIDKFPASRSAFSARRRLNKMERDGQL